MNERLQKISPRRKAEIQKLADAVLTPLAAVEAEVYQVRNRSSQDPLNYPIMLNNKIAALAGVVESADHKPTAQSYEVFDELSTALDGPARADAPDRGHGSAPPELGARAREDPGRGPGRQAGHAADAAPPVGARPRRAARRAGRCNPRLFAAIDRSAPRAGTTPGERQTGRALSAHRPPRRLTRRACYNAPVRTARRYVITGRVQGVGYRLFVRDAGRREGLFGHVRNLPDGRVEVEAEGADDALGRFEAALWRGPALARVDDVVIDDLPPSGHPGAFVIA